MNIYIQEAAASQQHSPIKAHPSEDDIENEKVLSSSSEGGAIIGSKRPSYAPPFHPTLHAARQTGPKLKPLQMSGIQSKFIADTMQDLRGHVAKRQKIDVAHVKLNGAHEQYESTLTSCRRGDEESSCTGGHFDLLDELDARPDTIHVVATSGGLITHWNEAFCKITKPSASLQRIPLTIFELVDSKSLPSLFSMLALALHNIGIVEAENFSLHADGQEEDASSSLDKAEGRSEKNDKSMKSSSSHLSITLPCKSFRNSSTSYNITVVFMDDAESMKRCFLGILTPRMTSQDCKVNSDDISYFDGSSLSSGQDSQAADEEQHVTTKVASNEQSIVPCKILPFDKILRMDDDLLCQMLLGSTLSVK